MHLSCSYWFTSDSFCLRLSPLTTIWRCFILFFKEQRDTNESVRYILRQDCPCLGCSCQFITTYLSVCGRGIFLDLHRTFWVLSPLIPQFTVSLLKFSSQTSLFLIKPAAMESLMTTVDVLLFAFRIAACLLSVFKLPVFVKSSSRVGGSQRKVVTWW